MLLRSTSTPLLGSLVTGNVQWDYSLDFDRDPCAHSQSFWSSGHSIARSCLTPPPVFQQLSGSDDVRSVDGGDRDLSAEKSPFSSFRKVRSENDLQRFCRATSLSAAGAAADSLLLASPEPLRKDVATSNPWPRSRRMSLRRHSSLSSIASLSSQSLGSELEMEEAALSHTEQDAICEVDEFIPGTPVSGLQFMSLGESLTHNTATDLQIVEEDSLPLFNQNGQKVAVNNRQGESLEHEFAKNSGIDCLGQTATFSGRNSLDFSHFVDGRGSGFNATSVLRSQLQESSFVSHEEKVGPMYIAGGFGMNGGGNGRRVSGGGNGGGSGDSLGADAYYRQLLDSNPGNPLLLRNYAKFLHEVKKEPRKAEVYYERAILANPGDGEILGLYAKLIWDVYRDEERAGRYFDRAIQAAPDDCYVMAAYASFLWNSESGQEESFMEVGSVGCGTVEVGA